MSAKVSFIVVRKHDSCPWAQYYLGGNGTMDAIDAMPHFPYANSEDGRLIRVADAEHAEAFLRVIHDDCYADSDDAVALRFIRKQELPDDFAYFVLIE
jgi:hypothetical protein